MTFLDCDNKNLSLMQIFARMVKDDGTGKPIISLNINSILQSWYTCENSKRMPIEMLAKRLIVKDVNNKPAWNTTNQ